MKFRVPKIVEIDVTYIRVILPIRYGEDDLAIDFPLRRNPSTAEAEKHSSRHGYDVWDATISIDTGAIRDWPVGVAGSVEMKVCDEGVYILLDGQGKEIARREDYVPEIIPGDYGDYVDLQIDKNGFITNWNKGTKTIKQFFPKIEDER